MQNDRDVVGPGRVHDRDGGRGVGDAYRVDVRDYVVHANSASVSHLIRRESTHLDAHVTIGHGEAHILLNGRAPHVDFVRPAWESVVPRDGRGHDDSSAGGARCPVVGEYPPPGALSAECVSTGLHALIGIVETYRTFHRFGFGTVWQKKKSPPKLVKRSDARAHRS